MPNPVLTATWNRLKQFPTTILQSPFGNARSTSHSPEKADASTTGENSAGVHRAEKPSTSSKLNSHSALHPGPGAASADSFYSATKTSSLSERILTKDAAQGLKAHRTFAKVSIIWFVFLLPQTILFYDKAFLSTIWAGAVIQIPANAVIYAMYK